MGIGQIPRGRQAGQDVPKTRSGTTPWPGFVGAVIIGTAIGGLPEPADGGGADTPGACRALPGPGGRAVAVEFLGLVLVPGGRRPVGVQDQGPALLVDDNLVVVRHESRICASELAGWRASMR